MLSASPTIESLCNQLITLRQHLAAAQFGPLEVFFDDAAAEWLDTPRRAYGYVWYVKHFTEGPLPLPDMLVQLQAWCASSPTSYHAHLLYGQAWESAVGKIRTSYCADYVEQAQWAGAQMARDHGLAAYLRAIALHPRPAMALHRMMRLGAYLGEPQWLLDLAQGKDPCGHDALQAQWGPETWEGGLTLLKEYGDSLVDIPAALPPDLPRRAAGELDDGKTYWLRLALMARPGDSDVLGDYLYFLYPRWGGSHAEMEAFIEGPICAGLSEHERDELRFAQALDYLGFGAYPDADDTERLEAFADEFERCLQLDLSPLSRVRALCLYADFHRSAARSEDEGNVHWDRDRLQRAYDLLAEAMVSAPAAVDFTGKTYPNTLYTLQACLWFNGMPDTQELLGQVLDRAVRWGNDSEAQLLAAIGSRFGLFGIEKGAHDPAALIDQALASTAPEINITQLGSNLWDYVPHEAVLFLWQECAARGNGDGYMGMSELYAGKIDPTFNPIDEALSLQWLRKAAEAGHSIARCNLVFSITDSGEPLSTAQYAQCKEWMEDVWENEGPGTRLESAAATNLAWLMMHGDIDEDRRASLDEVLAWMWAEDDDRDQRVAAYSYAEAFLEGRGCAPNRYLAKIWIDRALAISPDNEHYRDMADKIYRRGTFLGAWRAALDFRRARGRIDDRAHRLTFGRGEPDFA
ncbi:DUF4034 domain-containing protein [Serratia nevei]|uniref:DUF4034 domain-containing protein n=1 Tax=Serratia nevei TaxID=2703794 RepID=UPI00209DDCAE|nr:DUF4034 domain-containing protein [Serratia nevei]MCP1107763.1 DUF4034 domain-containing protein [Serratia nevei]